MIVRRIISVICTAAMMASIVMSSYAVSQNRFPIWIPPCQKRRQAYRVEIATGHAAFLTRAENYQNYSLS